MSKLSTIPKLEYATSARPWKPHKYQEKAIAHLLGRGGAGLFLDPGLGKTSITLASLKILKREKLMQRTLIIAPLRVVYEVWPVEVEKWTDFNGLRVVVLHGPKKDELLKEDADIYVINPEGLSWLMTGKNFKTLDADTLVIDESSKFKSTKTERFKLLKKVLPKFRRRWILTGTPASNGLMDLFGQVYIMDLGASLGQYITHFRAKYFVPVIPKAEPGEDRKAYSYQWAPAEGAEELIYEQLRPYVLRLSAEDHLTLPKRIDNPIRVELPPKARKVYDEMEQEMFAELGDGSAAVALSSAASHIKCRQIANGGLYKQFDLEDRPLLKKDEWIELHSAKTDAVLDLVEELQGSPVLIAYDFAHDRARLLNALGKDTPYIGGGASPAKVRDLVRRWNAGELPVLLGHPAAMGHGLNMQESGHHMIWHSLTWDLELYDQMCKRILRQGSKAESVTFHHIIAKGTIDEVIMRALTHKDKVQMKLLNALKEYRAEKIISKKVSPASRKRGIL